MTVGRQQPESIDGHTRHEGHPSPSDKPETALVRMVQTYFPREPAQAPVHFGSSFVVAANVCFWLQADIPRAGDDVRFESLSGHSWRRRERPMLTHNGLYGSIDSAFSGSYNLA